MNVRMKKKTCSVDSLWFIIEKMDNSHSSNEFGVPKILINKKIVVDLLIYSYNSLMLLA